MYKYSAESDQLQDGGNSERESEEWHRDRLKK